MSPHLDQQEIVKISNKHRQMHDSAYFPNQLNHIWASCIYMTAKKKKKEKKKKSHLILFGVSGKWNSQEKLALTLHPAFWNYSRLFFFFKGL